MCKARTKTSKKVKPSGKSRFNGEDSEPVKRAGRPPNKPDATNSLDMFNKALAAANGSREVWEVVADDGDRKEYRGRLARKRAYKQSLLWMMEGYECTLREIHEYKPSLRLEILD